MLHCNECDSKAIVRSSEKISSEVVRKYYQCTNIHCGHTFRSTESFDHTISPPAGKNQQLVLGLLMQMPEQDRQEIFKRIA